MLRAIGNRAVEYRWLDWLVATLLAGGHALLAWRTNSFDVLRTTGFANRLSLYTDMITVAGLLFGFAATALATYLAFQGQQINTFRAQVGGKVLAQWMSTLVGLLLTLIVLVVCKVVDRDGTTASGVRWLAEGALIFAVLRMSRLLWVFTQIVHVATTPPAPGRRRRTEPIGVREPAS